MERKAFKQRMQNLKSYQENNPGKGYWDWKVQEFEGGGEVKDPSVSKTTRDIVYDYEDNQRKINKIGKRPLEEGLKPAFNLEDFANFTPVGDAISVKDTYNAIKEKDWLGTTLAAASLLPFVPNIAKRVKGSAKQVLKREVPSVQNYRSNLEDALEASNKAKLNNHKLIEEYIDQRNRTLELMNTPEARRRAQDIDAKYGTEYSKAYDYYTGKYEDINEYVKLPEPKFVNDAERLANVTPSESDVINMSTDLIKVPEDYTPGLIRHEFGHIVDEMAYPGGIRNNYYLKQLGRPSKYRSFDEVSDILNTTVERRKKLYDYLRMPTEKKSIMNEFDEYLMNNYNPMTYPSNTKQFREAIEMAPETQKRMKELLKIHVKPNILYKDFMSRPLVNAETNKNLV